MQIYTKTGDTGETGLFDGTRVSKADARVEAYGDVDELNAWLGVARAHEPGADVDDAAQADPARSVRARRRCSPIPRTGSRRASNKATRRRRRRHASRAGDRPARDDAAAAAPVHSRRRLAGRRACCTSRAPSAVAPSAASSRSARRGRSARRSRTSIGCPICCSSWRARPTTAPASPKSSGNRRRLRALPRAPGAPALREFSGRVAPAAAGGAPAHRRDLRVRANRRRLRRRGRPHRCRSARAARRLARAAARRRVPAGLATTTPTPAPFFSRSADTMRRCRARRAALRRSAERVPAGRAGQALRDLGRPARLLPPIGQSGRPARASVSRLSRRPARRAGPTRSARRSSSRTSGRIWSVDWQKGRLYVPPRPGARRRAPTSAISAGAA